MLIDLEGKLYVIQKSKFASLDVNEIRPAKLTEENQRLRVIDAEELVKRKEEFVYISCPACETNNYQEKFEKDGFSFVQCLKCQTYFINPRPTFEMINEFYEDSRCMKHWKKFFSETEKSRREHIFKPRVNQVLELCKKYNINNKLLLDVGAGFGTFCEEVREKNFFEKIIALEPSHELAEACRKKGLEVIEQPIENTHLKEVDIITNFELIEHLFWPKDFINACSKILSNDGLFILTTPNVKGFDLLTLGKLHINFAGPNHLNYFHPKSLVMLLQNCNFEVLEILTPGKLDAEMVRNKIISNEINTKNQPFLKYILLDEWDNLGKKFQKFLADNLLSSHLWIVARKT